MNIIIDRVTNHLIPEADGVVVFVDNESGNVAKKFILKHTTGGGL